jgi:N-acetylated-alpha-linked acidic dipeptidase
MRKIGSVVCALAFIFTAAAADAPAPLRGYSAESSRVQREWEAKFRAIPTQANLKAYQQRLAARPHHVGSAYDRENAQWILSKFREWGLEAQIETFQVLMPTPKERVLELVEPAKYTAKLQEPAVAGDSTSGRPAEELPTYNAYSADGDVTAPLVYVNYGVPDDYDQLEKLGISVKGAIVIARYGGSWRGIKPKVAAEHGAVGCMIYSDPRDDGYFQGDVFPAGPWRPSQSVQRGSVMDMPLYPGDPLTPGIGATASAKRLPLAKAETLTRIPVLPISYGDAEPLLRALAGPVAPQNWRGALPFTYHIGPGPAKVHLKVASNWDLKPVNDVIAKITGSEFPDQWIIRGNHHDGWVYGAEDPVAGANALMEEARGLAELVKQGWRPKRTIIYCLWDGEEEGLLGSTEWGETHAADLAAHAAVYINSDSNGRGFLQASGSHTLESLINDVARDIQDPETKLSVAERSRLARIALPAEREQARAGQDLPIGALGSGSDYTVFLDHLGVASLSLGFGGEGGGGVYHSIYDDLYWFSRFGDSDYSYGRALAQTAGTAVMRLAGADVLPYRFTNLAATVKRYASEVQKLASGMRDSIRETNREIEEGVFAAAGDPKDPVAAPKPELVPPVLDFAALDEAVAALGRSAARYDRALDESSAGNETALNKLPLREINAKLIESERRLTDPAGLPGRPWFKHQVYAPGFYTGYGVKTLPGVREAIEQRKWNEAKAEIARSARILQREADLVNSAAEELERIVP